MNRLVEETEGQSSDLGDVQVDSDHYSFSKYLTESRWASLRQQLVTIMRTEPTNVLEVGKGCGSAGALLRNYGVQYVSVDFDRRCRPDVVASVNALPFRDSCFDTVACFQVLEHLPFEQFRTALNELRRIARSWVILSLPDARRQWTYSLYIPWFGHARFSVSRPTFKSAEHIFDGEHYWEINKMGYDLRRIMREMESCGLIMDRSFRVFDNPYHRFFILRTSRDIAGADHHEKSY